ncbi:leucyl-tRNA synthetase [Meira miltonrushii]|uniref:leucine--tRNA ligase n=1 Tax=Meira miltonrushii TaxID=1280837 RepID=A0A316VDV4_9BASI|nr:leucyl-tRNA synthetase [Meira miltonrushii]PWN34453.1 leucyl-tRNA synthetase [Meira miltonrushii]
MASSEAAPSGPATGAEVNANGGPIQLENTSKRDFLTSLEKKYQQQWEAEKLFEVDSPMTTEQGLETLSPEEIREKYPKWLGTFPYPYMNGSLHLGHAFSMSKVDFMDGFQRMLGKRALFPLGFHATGMPIRASADKLIREIEMFGKDFSGYKEEEEPEEKLEPDTDLNASSVTQSNVAKATKGKLQAKNTGLKYQFQILESIGVPRSEIHKFTEGKQWLDYFPPIAVADCKSMGTRIDWRRSFITTDMNPFYDTFVRWQMNKLKAMDKVKFGERYTIYSPKDGQPCMDHDRSEGEALGPQEYTGLKMELVQWSALAAPELDAKLQGKKVYLVAATLRPETCYGQTNCFVGPNIDYSVFAVNDTEVFVTTPRAARNMTFQGITEKRGEVNTIATIKGSQLVGTKVRAPFAICDEVYVLPMETVLATKGTGVVTSCPSDSPDDFATWTELRKKPEYYKVDPAWVAQPPQPVLSTPTYGEMTAEELVKKFKIQSPKDKIALAEAKEIAYKEGFYSGTMVVGPFKGLPVQDAKGKVRDALLEAKLGLAYAEPEGKIISRSNDECVVALCDQWYMDYGEDSWKASAQKALRAMNTFADEILNAFEGTLNWLHQWACARSYGLGSKLPWDKEFLVESLSDSTIYMSYYTIAHLLQDGDIFGSKVGPLGVKADDLTDDVWDYILGDVQYPAASANTSVTKEVAERLRREFRYFYPMDLRSSGKDLIPNHLSFCIYNHTALFPEKHWPQAIRINGHLMLNGKKMSKSTGNALTLRQAVDKFGADACRISLADAGDSIEDANFEEKSANANILRLHTLLDWCQEMIDNQDKLRTGPKDNFWDKVFENDLNTSVEQVKGFYDNMLFKSAVKYGFYELQGYRDSYREATVEVGMHRDLVMQFMRLQALLMMPIAPHFSEHIWRGILGEKSTIQSARYPEVSAPVSKQTSESATYIRGLIKNIRDTELMILKRRNKGKKEVGGDYDEKKPKAVKVFVAKRFPEWQDRTVTAIRKCFNDETKTIDMSKLKNELVAANMIKDKRPMPFAQQFKKRIEEFGADVAFNRLLPFDEIETIQAASSYLKRTINLQELNLISADEVLAKPDGPKEAGVDPRALENAEPGSPAFVFYNV